MPESAGSLTSLLDMNDLWIALQQLYLASIANNTEIVVKCNFDKMIIQHKKKRKHGSLGFLLVLKRLEKK